MVDLTGDQHGNVRARLLAVALGWSGAAYARRLPAPPDSLTTAVPVNARGVRHLGLPSGKGGCRERALKGNSTDDVHGTTGFARPCRDAVGSSLASAHTCR